MSYSPLSRLIIYKHLCFLPVSKSGQDLLTGGHTNDKIQNNVLYYPYFFLVFCKEHKIYRFRDLEMMYHTSSGKSAQCELGVIFSRRCASKVSA